MSDATDPLEAFDLPALPDVGDVEIPPALAQRTVKLATLKPREDNPRTISPEDRAAFDEGLRSFGCVQPIIVNMHPDRKGRIVGGFQRWAIMVERGVVAYAVWQGSWDKPAEDELSIRLNRNGGEWDWDLLESKWDKGALQAWGFQDWEFGDVGAGADGMSNRSGGKVHSTPSYLGSSVKKFELLIAAADYDRVEAGLKAARLALAVPNNSAVFLTLLEPHMPAAADPPADGEPGGDG